MAGMASSYEAALVALTRGKTLADYTNMKRIGKSTTRDRYYCVNSVVIKAELGGFVLVLKAQAARCGFDGATPSPGEGSPSPAARRTSCAG